MRLVEPYKDLKTTLQFLKKQVIDSLPYIHQYIPSDIETPKELFYFLKEEVVGDGKGVTYEKDPPGRELLQTVQTLIDNNRHGEPGHGDCDCFTILVLASCHYLGFKPQYVRLVGRNKNSPSHIYSLVYDRDKKKVCAMDLTNPTYCMERNYPYKQTLDFMILELADGGLSGLFKRSPAKKAAKAEKKAIKQQVKVAKKQAKADRKIARTDRRTDRVVQKGERKQIKRAVKVQKKENKMIKAKGRGEIIQARQEGRKNVVTARKSGREAVINARTDKRLNRLAIPEGGGGESDYNEEAEATYAPSYQPESDESYEQNESLIPGGGYDAEDVDEVYDEFEYLPGEDEEESPEDYYEEDEEGMEDLNGPITDLIFKGGKKLVDKLKGTKAGQKVDSVIEPQQEIKNLKAQISVLNKQLEVEKKQKYYYGGGGFAGGALTGFIIKSLIK